MMPLSSVDTMDAMNIRQGFLSHLNASIGNQVPCSPFVYTPVSPKKLRAVHYLQDLFQGIFSSFLLLKIN